MSGIKCCECGKVVAKDAYFLVGAGIKAQGHKKCVQKYMKRAIEEQDVEIIANLPNLIGKPASWQELPNRHSVVLELKHNKTGQIVRGEYCHHTIYWDIYDEDNKIAFMTNMDSCIKDSYTVNSIVGIDCVLGSDERDGYEFVNKTTFDKHLEKK